MFEQLTAEEKLHLSKCIYEEPSLKMALDRLAIENVELQHMNILKEPMLIVYSRSPEHWENVKTVRADLMGHIDDHPYIPQLDRMKSLVHQLDDGQSRLRIIKKDDALNWTRMSAECRQILQALREEARILSLTVDDLEDEESLPRVIRELRKLRDAPGLKEQLQELGVLPAN